MRVELPDLIPMQPYYRECAWGGQRLRALFGKDLPTGVDVGESFEFSALPGQESTVAGGPLSGRGLADLAAEFGPDLVGAAVWRRFEGGFPLLIKLIDACDDLSVQVHPDDAYARARGLGSQGKMEAWLVLDSEDGAAVFGLRDGTDRALLEQSLAAGRIEEVVCRHDLDAGDLLFVPPGVVHALCRGTVIYEVQQSSDLTFRLYDYGRPGLDGRPRELHIDAALDVIHFDALPGPAPWSRGREAGPDGALLVDCDYFRLHLHRLGKGAREHGSMESFQALTVIRGAASVRGAAGAATLRAGDSLLVPAGRGYAVEGNADLEYLVATPVAD